MPRHAHWNPIKLIGCRALASRQFSTHSVEDFNLIVIQEGMDKGAGGFHPSQPRAEHQFAFREAMDRSVWREAGRHADEKKK